MQGVFIALKTFFLILLTIITNIFDIYMKTQSSQIIDTQCLSFVNLLEMKETSRNWFEETFGFKETTENIKQYIVKHEGKDGIHIRSTKNGKEFNSGIFKIKDKKYFDSLSLPPRNKGTFNIISGNGKATKHMEMINILQSEGEEKFNGTTFQVASNFHCLDHMRGCRPPKHGISEYQLIGTQGPAATACCAPSLLVRNYLMKDISLVPNLELIDGVPYINEDRDFSNVSFSIGSHTNCQVTMCGNKDGSLKLFEDNKQMVNHCLCAALDFSGPVKRTKATEELGRRALEEQYELTILSAWENSINFKDYEGSNKCVLTLLGCGVFDNKIEDASKAIAKSLETIKKSGLDVYLVCFTKDQFKESYKYLQDVIKATNGKVIEA